MTSGEENAQKVDKLGNSVLSLGWDPVNDIIEVDAHGNAVDLLYDLSNPSKLSLTKRETLGIINKPYDLLGLISPITIRLKCAYRDLFRVEPPLGWDDPMPYELKMEWIELLKLLRDVDTVKFPRATKPKNAVGEPELIGYFDGSDNAYACVVYLRWILSDDSVEVKLACSSSRVTPLKRLTTPRAELNGAVMLSRLVSTLVKSYSLSESLPSKVWLFGDSECTLASIEKTSGAFGKYFGNRIGEIHENLSKIEKF